MAAEAAISCSEAHSRTEWYSWPPSKMLGVGKPRALSCEPSVPPRIGSRARLDALGAHRLGGGLDDARLRLQMAPHVAVLLPDLDLEPRPRLGVDDLVRQSLEQRDVLVEELVVEVADDRSESGPATAVPSSTYGWMNPSRPLGRLRRERVERQRGDHARGEPHGVHELALREAGVDVDAGDRHADLDAGEGLILQLAEPGAVDRVRARGAEALEVEQRCAVPDLLVRRERDPQRRARQTQGAPADARPRP